MNNWKEQTVEGVKYPTLISLVRAYGTTRDTVYKRYSRGRRGNDLIPTKLLNSYKAPPQNSVLSFTVGRYSFKNAHAACRELGIDYNKYRARLRQGWSQEEALEIVPKLDGRKHAQRKTNKRVRRNVPLTLFGKAVKSFKEVATITGIKEYVLYQRVRTHGRSLEEAVLMGGKSKALVVDGEEYESEAAFARAVGVPAREIYTLLGRFTPKQIANGEHEMTTRTVVHNGVRYPHSTALAQAHGLTLGQLNYRLDACDGNLEQALALAAESKVAATIYGTKARLYIAEISDTNYSGISKKRYKVGITQRPLDKRYKTLPFRCVTVFYKRGEWEDLRKTEKEIKTHFRNYLSNAYSSRDFDGFSEVYELNDSELKRLIFAAKFDRFEEYTDGEELAVAS